MNRNVLDQLISTMNCLPNRALYTAPFKDKALFKYYLDKFRLSLMEQHDSCTRSGEW